MFLVKSRLSAFDRKVYVAVLRIPLGRSRSYAWVARQIGSPQSARAVGNSLHKNPLMPYVPCHRVIASDGSWGGYSRGLNKKIQLLKREKNFCRELISRGMSLDKAKSEKRNLLLVLNAQK